MRSGNNQRFAEESRGSSQTFRLGIDPTDGTEALETGYKGPRMVWAGWKCLGVSRSLRKLLQLGIFFTAVSVRAFCHLVLLNKTLIR
jgi:hypothetical protein